MSTAESAESLDIRLLETIEDLTRVRELEKLIWDDDDSIPVHQTATAVKNGGMVIGAYLGEKLIGFQYSFAGFDGKKAYLCSHTMGIHPDYRVKGIGEKLKRRQRLEALRNGYDLIRWTYDPLETVNGNINIRKLGAVCSQYIENCYGDMIDALNAGVPSDRFLVEWHITSDRVQKRLDEPATNREESVPNSTVIDIAQSAAGFPEPLGTRLEDEVDSSLCFVPVPADFQKMKEHDLDLAIRWRLITREVFTHLFQRGFRVEEFVRNNGSEPVHYYVLRKQEK